MEASFSAGSPWANEGSKGGRINPSISAHLATGALFSIARALENFLVPTPIFKLKNKYTFPGIPSERQPQDLFLSGRYLGHQFDPLPVYLNRCLGVGHFFNNLSILEVNDIESASSFRLSLIPLFRGRPFKLPGDG